MSLKFLHPLSYIIFTGWTIFIVFMLWGENRLVVAMPQGQQPADTPYVLARVLTWLLFETIVSLYFISLKHPSARELVRRYSVYLIIFFALLIFHFAYTLQEISSYYRIHLLWLLGIVTHAVFMIVIGFVMKGRAKITGYPTNP